MCNLSLSITSHVLIRSVITQAGGFISCINGGLWIWIQHLKCPVYLLLHWHKLGIWRMGKFPFQFFCSLSMWFSVLMLVVLSRYEPADALCAQDRIDSEACDEKDREDQQPVNGLHWDAGQRALVVCIPHHPVSCGIKPCSSVKMGGQWATKECKLFKSV